MITHIYFKNSNNEVFAYETLEERNKFGSADLVQMTEEEVADHLAPKEPEVVVPSKVTMRQARLALLQAGLLDDTEALIASLEGPEGQAARIEWDYSSEVWRNKPFVITLGAQLGLDDEQLDALFIAASQID